MKKRFYLYILSLLAFTGTGCKKMLDIQPVNSMIPVSVKDYESLLMGGYPRVEFFMKTEMLTDNVYANLNSLRDPDRANEAWFVWAPSHLLDGVMEDPYWTEMYKTIFYANTVLDNFSKRTPDAADKVLFETVKGEAHALRAYAYFYLVNLYADVYSQANLNLPGVPMPLTADDIRKNTGNNVREPIGNVYRQIETDLNLATQLLTGKIGKNKYRFDATSVELLKARVYLFTNQYEKAIQSASDVMASKPLWNMNEMQTYLDSKESEKYAFSLNMGVIDLDYKNEVLFHVGGRGNNNIYYYAGNMLKPSLDLLALCDRANWKDYRKYIYASLVEQNTAEGIQTGLTVYNMYAKQENPTYYIGLKLSEAYVIRAEAYARTKQNKKAIDDLNGLLSRRILKAHFQPFTEASFADDAALLQRVLEERRVELAFEGMRWFDLRRLGKPRLEHVYKNGKTYELKLNDPRYILQIPPTEQENSPEMPLNPR